jgi:tRNA pseudouridine55 synthase
LNVNKPAGLTSHDVVARIRRTYRLKKVGHAGTLDPLATGILIVCIGGATRLSEYVMRSDKRYHAVIHLGISTDTYDAEGKIQATRDASTVTRAYVEAQLQLFLGHIRQTPPMYSAIKTGGKKLYEIARTGRSIERAARAVWIGELTLLDWSPPRFTLAVLCSAGTYVRSLAFDLGEMLGVGAHLAALTRTASGSFGLEQSVAVDELLSCADWTRYLISPRLALAELQSLDLSAAESASVLHGRSIPAASIDERRDQPVLAYAPDGRPVAIVRLEGDQWQPEKVFPPE